MFLYIIILIISSEARPIDICAILSPRLLDGSEKPIAFVSRTLNMCERKYAQIDKGLVLVFTVCILKTIYFKNGS